MGNEFVGFFGRLLITAFVSSVICSVIKVLNEANGNGDIFIFILVMILLNNSLFKK